MAEYTLQNESGHQNVCLPKSKMDLGCAFAQGHAQYLYDIQCLSALTAKQAEKNYKDTKAGGVKGTWHAKALDDPFRETEHKTSTIEKSENR